MLRIDVLRSDPLPWLLSPDPANPFIRYFALRDLLDRPSTDPELLRARAEIMSSGPVPAILNAQHPEGYWFKPGTGYSPKYRATVWQIILLAELGADPSDERVRRGCEYLLNHNPAATGGFSYNESHSPSGVVHCLNGNLLYALFILGYAQDPRVLAALDWQVQAVTGQENFEYYYSGTSGPGFACGINLGQPCGWGANKAIKALSAIPSQQRTRLYQANVLVRDRSGMSWVSEACSMDRNGPTSFPLGLMMPTVAASRSR
jgi:hypothetical protein